MNYDIEFEQEEDGRWIAEIPALPGVMAYGISTADAESKVEAIASGSSQTASSANTPR